MQKLLRELVEMRSGVYARRQMEGKAYYLQARDFNDAFQLHPASQLQQVGGKSLQGHYLQPGDVLIAAKGTSHFATVFPGELDKPAVASSVFVVLHGFNRQKVLPDYLAWFLNHPRTQGLLKQQAGGTSLPVVGKKVLGALEMPLPSLHQQRLVGKIDRLQTRERQIRERISRLRKQQVQQQLLDSMRHPELA